MSENNTDPRQPIWDILELLRRDYERAAEPYLKMLADYESHLPPKPIFLDRGAALNIDAYLAREAKP
jgi:hypothetical protein